MAGESLVSLLSAQRQSSQLSNQLARAAVALFLVIALSAAAGLYWATSQSDQISVERQLRVASHSIDIALDELALQQETVAIWDDSALEMTREVPHQQWLFDNIGSWLHRIFRHDETYLLDGHDRPVQVVVEGKRQSTARFWTLRDDLDLLVHSARGNLRKPGRHDRQPHLTPNPGSSVRTTDRATHDTHLMLVGGRPAVASAMLIQPSTPGYASARGGWPVLVSVRYLNDDFMRELESRYLIDRPRFSPTRTPGPGELALELRTEWDSRLGYLIWTPQLPGSRILKTLLPLAISGLALLGLLILMLSRSLRQTLSERAAFEARASHLAYHDALTGLPNRALLGERLQAALSEDHQPSSPISLLLIDLDRFKQINDTLGHLAGDQLIREFASRLLRLVRGRDTVARLGGDEFAVLLCDGWKSSEVHALCGSILDLFRVPFDVLDTTIFGGASIGAVISDRHVRDATELMRRADVALYRAKADGRGCFRLFERSMDERGKARTQLETALRQAMQEDQFAIWCQPQVGRRGEPVGQEVLLRWHHPTLGRVGPQEIIPLAEETGLILPIGEWVLKQAARAAATDTELFTAVNLSPLQLREPGFAERLIAIFESAGACASRVELEMTEQILLDDTSAAAHNLRRLRQCGFRIALDDFGTGYSSLSYLRRLQVDKIKIDRSFVLDLQRSKEARSIVAAIVTLGRALGLTVCAEGVETEAQAEILIASGCDQLQGFLFGEPAPPKCDREPRRLGA